MLSAYDLEDKILISLLNTEAEKASLSSSVRKYNKTASNGFTLYFLEALPKWATDEFLDRSRPIRELKTDEGKPVHGKVITLLDNRKAVLMFETKEFVQATSHIINIVKFIILGCIILLILGIYYSYKVSINITKPITNFSKFVSENDDLKTYYETDDHKAIAELQTLIKGYNKSIQQQRDLIARESQLNQDISHELRTPLSVIYGASEVLQNADDKKHSKAALERIFRVSGEMQDLVNGILWLAKPMTKKEMSKYNCDIEELVNTARKKYIENMGVPAGKITLKIKNSCNILLPPDVLHVILRNLIANAVTYSCDNQANIDLSDGLLIISNYSEQLISSDTAGFGVGLTIVNRLCVKFNIETEYISTGSQIVFKLDFTKLMSS